MKRLLIVLGVISIIAYSTVANALTGFIDSNGDASPNNWDTSFDPAPGHFTGVDDGTRSPGTPDVSDYLISSAMYAGGDGIEVFNMTTIVGAGSVTNITAVVYGKIQSDAVANVNLIMNGTPTTATTTGWTTSDSWKTVSFDGTWTQTDLDNCQLKIVSATSGRTCTFYAGYCVVTYTTGGGGGATTKAYFIKKKKGITFIK